MSPQFEYSTLANPEDIQKLGNILDQCFVGSPGDSETYIDRVGAENLRLLRQSQQIAGGLATIAMGQWFGGQRVPMTGIAAVGIAPEYRGTGAAIAMMQHTLKELYANGVPISVLYPATQRLYRKAGYEQGGSACTWEISTQSIQVREQPLALGVAAEVLPGVVVRLAGGGAAGEDGEQAQQDERGALEGHEEPRTGDRRGQAHG